MIRIEELTEKDVGRWVKWKDPNGFGEEIGRIKSWNDRYIFVVYRCDKNWDRFQDYTGVATRPEELTFLEDILDETANCFGGGI